MRVALVNPPCRFDGCTTHSFAQVSALSEIQDDRVVPLPELEVAGCR